ncbi:MAG: prolyl oligopeptidase family serine peptidase [Verrucomicrobiota bacterium]
MIFSLRPLLSSRLILAAAISALPLCANAQAPRPIPPAGIAVPDTERAELTAGVAELGREIASLKEVLRSKPELLELLPDVQIFHKAVDWALRYDEFFDVKQFAGARQQLALGMQRARELREGTPSWTSATGLVVRGYLSMIDGSIQPYGLVIPDSWKSDKTPRRLDFWMHGRGEKLSELSFVGERLRDKGEFTPAETFVLHLYGRFCCANKFAGESDLFEALAHARKHYPIDPDRLVVRGFSMGGASCWQFATHFPGMWAAAAPGAGFAESKEFLRLNTPEKLPPPWEQTLWRWYDSTLYAANLANCPTVAYSGELDGQKQAADIMIRHLEKEGLTIPHIIGPKTEHKYHPESKPKIEEFLAAAIEKGREKFPRHLRFTTYTLIYPRLHWLELRGMEKQWERADLIGDLSDAGEMEIKTANVSGFTITLPEGLNPAVRRIVVDGQKVAEADRCISLSLNKTAGKWSAVTAAEENLSLDARATGSEPAAVPLRKEPGLCGPIDHAFMSRFIMVRPTGKPLNATIGAWATAELDHATAFWRRVFRGDAPVLDDTALSPADIAHSNLILWGDPSSNAVLAKILPKLPIQWDGGTIRFGGKSYDAAHHAPILIFPNPLNPERYIVINSGVTFREEALLNNARQTPKLPDWAIVDLRTPPGPLWPGLVTDAGFFNESWQAAGSN